MRVEDIEYELAIVQKQVIKLQELMNELKTQLISKRYANFQEAVHPSLVAGYEVELRSKIVGNCKSTGKPCRNCVAYLKKERTHLCSYAHTGLKGHLQHIK